VNIYVFAGFILLLLFGFVDNSRGPLLPLIKDSFHLSYSQSGTFLFLTSLAFFLSCFPLMGLIEKKGDIFTAKLGIVLLVIAVLLVSFAPNIPVLYVGSFLMGGGLSMLAVSCNHIVQQASPAQHQAQNLGFLHGFYGLGSLIAASTMPRLLGLNWSWSESYQISLYLMGAVLLYFLFLSDKKLKNLSQNNSQPNHLSPWSVVKDPWTLYFCLFFFFYVGSEVSVSIWLVSWSQEVQGLDIKEASYFLSLFFVCLMAGRFLGPLIMKKYSLWVRVVLCEFAACVFLLLGFLDVAGSEVSLFFIALAALSMSIVFPTTMALFYRL